MSEIERLRPAPPPENECHVRYGGHGVIIYWHVERKSVCVYSQLKSCSASEV
jgi:TnpA family transposase